LGYYSRARNLHKAAQQIRDKHNGVFPSNFDDVVALPGIGQSTAGAILTFAFDQPHPILDGNVKRVLARLLGLDLPTQDTKAIQALWDATTKLVPESAADAYPWNQALMELGASLCSRTKPDCEACPWATRCIAKNSLMQDTLPRSKPTKQTPHHTIGVGIVWKDDKVLIALRPEEGLLGGLWEFPGGKCKSDELITECIVREIQEETGLTVQITSKVTEVKHAYSHFKITLHAYECEYISGDPKPLASQALKWVTLDEIHQFAFPKANKHVLEALCHKPDRQLTLC
jgi:A/G-specific adenine glycosylase